MAKLNIFRNSKDAKNYPAGEVLFERGETGDEMYIIIEGEVDIKIDEKVVQTLGEGDFFGEMGIIDGSPRSATAVTSSECRLLPVNEKRFTFLIQQTPFFALHVMKEMADRLRTANARQVKS
jgi:CRP-like cAMP-binding protein